MKNNFLSNLLESILETCTEISNFFKKFFFKTFLCFLLPSALLTFLWFEVFNSKLISIIIFCVFIILLVWLILYIVIKALSKTGFFSENKEFSLTLLTVFDLVVFPLLTAFYIPLSLQFALTIIFSLVLTFLLNDIESNHSENKIEVKKC